MSKSVPVSESTQALFSCAYREEYRNTAVATQTGCPHCPFCRLRRAGKRLCGCLAASARSLKTTLTPWKREKKCRCCNCPDYNDVNWIGDEDCTIASLYEPRSPSETSLLSGTSAGLAQRPNSGMFVQPEDGFTWDYLYEAPWQGKSDRADPSVMNWVGSVAGSSRASIAAEEAKQAAKIAKLRAAICTIPVQILRNIWTKESHIIWTEERTGRVKQELDETHRHLLRQALPQEIYRQIMPLCPPYPPRMVLSRQDQIKGLEAILLSVPEDQLNKLWDAAQPRDRGTIVEALVKVQAARVQSERPAQQTTVSFSAEPTQEERARWSSYLKARSAIGQSNDAPDEPSGLMEAVMRAAEAGRQSAM